MESDKVFIIRQMQICLRNHLLSDSLPIKSFRSVFSECRLFCLLVFCLLGWNKLIEIRVFVLFTVGAEIICWARRGGVI